MKDPADTTIKLDAEWADTATETTMTTAEPAAPPVAKPPLRPGYKPPLPRAPAEPKPPSPQRPLPPRRPAAESVVSRAEVSVPAPQAVALTTQVRSALPETSTAQAPRADALAPATLADALARVAPALPSALGVPGSGIVTPPPGRTPVAGAEQSTRHDGPSSTAFREPKATANAAEPWRSLSRGSDGSASGPVASAGFRTTSASRLKTSVCAFWLGPRCFGLEVDLVGEIVRVDAVVPVPLAPAPLLGLFNLRGLPVPLVDLAAVLELSEIRAPRAEDNTRFALLLRSGRLVAAALIDRMEVVLSADRSLYSAESGTDNPFVKGFVEVEERSGLVVTVLDSASVVRGLERLKSAYRSA